MLAFIDCFLETPVHNCFNQFILNTNIPATYHMVSRFGFDSLTSTRQSHTKYIILGSASNVTDPLDWHEPLATFIMEELSHQKPVLGICFGHQLMAKAFGAEIGFLEQDKTHFKELREIEFTQAWGSYQKEDKIQLAYAHEQAVLGIPEELCSIAKSKRSDYEILQHKTLPYTGIQAHPEASPRFFTEWLGITDYSNHLQTGAEFLNNFLQNH